MRRLIAISFLFVFASATTEFGQFLKLPVLIQHFYSHQQRGAVSLIEFLSQHYSSNHEDSDKKEDMKLPFKTVITGPNITASFSIPKIEVEKPTPQSPERTVPIKILFTPSQQVSRIFHPPRTV